METTNSSAAKAKSNSKIKVNWPQVGLQLGLAVTATVLGGLTQNFVLRALGSTLPIGESAAGNVVSLVSKKVV